MKQKSPAPEYEQQAIDFLEKNGMTFEPPVFIGHEYEAENCFYRDKWRLCIVRSNGRKLETEFPQSANKSVQRDEKATAKCFSFRHRQVVAAVNAAYRVGIPELYNSIDENDLCNLPYYDKKGKLRIAPNHGIAPNAYDMLACLQKYNPGSHANFCDDFGTDPDSIKGLETYNAVVQEWLKVSSFFTGEQLEELREIN